MVLIGVSDDAIGLIDDHRSIERCLSQIPMPRMKVQELEEIVTKGLDQINMSIENDALAEITALSKGLPTYVHLLALHAGRAAVDSQQMTVGKEHVRNAIKVAISLSEETIRAEYEDATSSSRETLYAEVLLACAMAKTDPHGRFVPNDVCEAMQLVTGKAYTGDRVAGHLKKFCSNERGYVLKRSGSRYRWKYQFKNPLLQPYVIMKGLDAKLISEKELGIALSTDEDLPLFHATRAQSKASSDDNRAG